MWDRFDICVKVDEVAYADIAQNYEVAQVGRKNRMESDNKELYSSAYMKECVEKYIVYKRSASKPQESTITPRCQ